MGATMSEAFPPKANWSVTQIPDLSGRVMIVTGGNTGVGYETCKELLKRDAKVYLAARSKERADAAIARLKQDTGKDAIFLPLDLSSLASVRTAATEFKGKEPALHVLFNNAGVMSPPIDALTKEGYDMQWGTNVLGHFYLTELLLPALEQGAKTSPDQHARVITTASSAAYSGKIDFTAMADTPERKKVGETSLYWQSKLGNAIVSHQAAQRYAGKGIVSISLNPGNLDSDLYRNFPSLVHTILRKTILYPNSYGALTQLYAGTMPEALKLNGGWMKPWARESKLKKAEDDVLGKQVWAWCADAVKKFEQTQ
ncbi:NAD-P-binding protein [Epithele typhae]|uniref:NAD-P-binding protein n=1 Tax=Epithele typhae TaxID=378194 RepID=UPI00200817E9|nr:NAD-P-binding protein [Epithele typhae]KAH9932792.1 NAD-P-binding protein [Epithele typhae]